MHFLPGLAITLHLFFHDASTPTPTHAGSALASFMSTDGTRPDLVAHDVRIRDALILYGWWQVAYLVLTEVIYRERNVDVVQAGYRPRVTSFSWMVRAAPRLFGWGTHRRGIQLAMFMLLQLSYTCATLALAWAFPTRPLLAVGWQGVKILMWAWVSR